MYKLFYFRACINSGSEDLIWIVHALRICIRLLTNFNVDSLTVGSCVRI
jgi:hypothetical protein